MPIEQHTSLTPPGETAQIWRYMDFTKYLSMLDQRSLYFSNVESLARTDPHEGMLSQPNFRHRNWKEIADLTPAESKELGMDSMDDAAKDVQFLSTKNSREYWSRRRFYDRRTFFVNCWHVNEDESAAMWSSYAPAEHGVAIVSNYSSVVDALAKTNDRIFATSVQYVDFVNEPVNSDLIFPISKRRSFSHQRELRLLYWDLDLQALINSLCAKLAHTMFRGVGKPARTEEIDWELIEDDVAKVKPSSGRNIPADIDALVKEVRVSPTADDWFVDLVQSVSRRYSFAPSVKRSDLRSSPIR